MHEDHGFPMSRVDRWSSYRPSPGHGIVVPVYDRHGRRFDMGLKKNEAKRGYRFFGTEWVNFVRANQLQEAMAAVAKEKGSKYEN